MRRSGLALVLLALLNLVGTAWAGDVTVRVVGLRSDAGAIHVAVWDDPEGFPDGDAFLMDRVVSAESNGVTAVFPGLAPGAYAFATYHDEDRDGEFDQGFLGVPLEGYAFSNDVRPFLSPPPFSAAAVEVGADASEIVITMWY